MPENWGYGANHLNTSNAAPTGEIFYENHSFYGTKILTQIVFLFFLLKCLNRIKEISIYKKLVKLKR